MRVRTNSQDVDIEKFKCITYFTCFVKKNAIFGDINNPKLEQVQ